MFLAFLYVATYSPLSKVQIICLYSFDKSALAKPAQLPEHPVHKLLQPVEQLVQPFEVFVDAQPTPQVPSHESLQVVLQFILQAKVQFVAQPAAQT